MSIRHELQIAAQAFIAAAKSVMGDRAPNVGVVLLGGAAVISVTRHRLTEDIDFYVTGIDRRALRDEIVRKCNPKGGPQIWSPNFEGVCGLTYTLQEPNKAPVYIRVDIINNEVTLYNVSSRILAQLEGSNLPWGSREDLICTKLKGAHARFHEGNKKARQDVHDVEALIGAKPGVLTNPAHKAFCVRFLPDLLEISGLTKEMWEKELGIKLP